MIKILISGCVSDSFKTFFFFFYQSQSYLLLRPICLNKDNLGVIHSRLVASIAANTFSAVITARLAFTVDCLLLLGLFNIHIVYIHFFITKGPWCR